MKRLIAIFSVIALLLINVPYTREEKRDIPVVITSNGVRNVIKMSESDANELAEKLGELKESITNGDMENARSIAHSLKKYGFNLERYLGENRSNFKCLLVGYGIGYMWFTADIILMILTWVFIWFLLFSFLDILFDLMLHLIPFRIFLPISLVLLNSGGITTIGMNGTWSVTGKEIWLITGFSGITIDIGVIPYQQLIFLLGPALGVNVEKI